MACGWRLRARVALQLVPADGAEQWPVLIIPVAGDGQVLFDALCRLRIDCQRQIFATLAESGAATCTRH